MRKFLLASLVAASAALVGCQDAIDAPNLAQEDGSVQFSTYVGRGASRASVTNTANLNAFGVFGYMGGTSGFDPAASIPDFMYNQLVERDGAGVNTWHYSPVKYWPQDDALKTAFFAYAPYAATEDIAAVSDEAESAIVEASSNTAAGNPTVRYHVGTDVARQQDLIYASTGDLTNAAKTVVLEFNHALSRVAFRIKGWEADDPNSIYGTGTTVTINSVKLATKRKAATLDLGTGLWSDPDNSESWRGYAITPNSGMVANAKSDVALEDNDLFQIQSGSTETMTLTAEDGYVMLLPEINPEDNDKYMLFVDYTVRTEDDALAGGFVEYRNNVYRFFTPHFEQGKAYAITIHLGMNGTPGADDGDYDEPFDPADEPDNDPENPAHPAADVAEIAFTQTVIDWDSAADKNLNYTGDHADPGMMSFVVRTTSANESVSLPFVEGACPAELTIDWGDGTVTTGVTTIGSSNNSHAYASAGDYTITIVSAQKDVTKQQVPEYTCEDYTPLGAPANVISHRSILRKHLIELCSPLLNSDARSLKYLFSECSGLTSIPEGLFDNCTEVTDFSYAFSSCTALQSIPAGLFDKCTKVLTFQAMFMDCTSLTSIPDGLFDYNTEVTNFSQMFSGCSTLTSISEGLFDNCTEVTNFERAFWRCTRLTSIPEHLFDHCTQVTDFSYAFASCSGLQSIPTGLFDNCSEVTDFEDAFGSCFTLTNIPEGLFNKCTKVTSFHSTFDGCTGLTEIPAGLFDNCSEVTDFGYTFSRCSGITSNVPELWDATRWPNVTTRTKCFNGCTNAANYSSIPSGWK